MTARIRRHPLAEQAAEVILARVTTGEWPLGHKLPGETTLAVELGVGRSTVREAIRELAGRGILQTRQGAGVFVLSTDVTDDWETVVRRADIDDVIEGRTVLETEATRLAALRRTPADLRTLRSLLRARTLAARDADDEAYVDADIAFHRAVVVAAHNPVLVELFQSFVPRSRQAMIDMLRIDASHRNHRNHRTEEDEDTHTAIVDAIRDHRSEDAAQTARHHLTALRRGRGPR